MHGGGAPVHSGRTKRPKKAELKKLAAMPSNAAGQSPSAMDGPATLSAASARQWLGVWVRLEHARSRAMIGTRVTGPGVSRPPPSRTHRVGRAMHGKKGQSQQYELEDGAIAGSSRAAGEALIWDAGAHLVHSAHRFWAA